MNSLHTYSSLMYIGDIAGVMRVAAMEGRSRSLFMKYFRGAENSLDIRDIYEFPLYGLWSAVVRKPSLIRSVVARGRAALS